MNYCILIQLSRTSISFWYQQQGSPFEPLAKNEGNVVPLYFYVNCNDFSFGRFAKEHFLNGDTNTFGDYFKIIEDPSKYFKIFGDQKHVKFLLYYAVELYLSHFLKTVLYKKDSIEEYRNSIPLRFMFSSDIVRKERLLVESIFTESGYDNVDTISYSQFLFSTLVSRSFINPQFPVILLTGIDGNLFIELFKGIYNSPVAEEIVEDQGADPRIKIMSKMLYESAISTTHSALNEKNETAHLLSCAKTFLDHQSAIPRGNITLSDGTILYVQIKKKEINQRLTYDIGEEKIFKAIDNLLTKNSISGNQVQFVLNGEAVNTSYFIERLKKKFSQVVGTPNNIQNDVLKLVFKSIADADYSPLKKEVDVKYLIPQPPELPKVQKPLEPLKIQRPPELPKVQKPIEPLQIQRIPEVPRIQKPFEPPKIQVPPAIPKIQKPFELPIIQRTPEPPKMPMHPKMPVVTKPVSPPQLPILPIKKQNLNDPNVGLSNGGSKKPPLPPILPHNKKV
jgi:hypothetical protein